jgi:aspartyl-tRNA(Asn)/glutamyl-tRNA(Gln) amidotransferase subunit C
MSEINEENVKLLSQLCRIELSAEELVSLSADLKRILTYVGQLQELDVNHLSPHSHIDEQGITSLRPDSVSKHLPKEIFLANAPDQVGGMIRVPPVIKQAP